MEAPARDHRKRPAHAFNTGAGWRPARDGRGVLLPVWLCHGPNTGHGDVLWHGDSAGPSPVMEALGRAERLGQGTIAPEGPAADAWRRPVAQSQEGPQQSRVAAFGAVRLGHFGDAVMAGLVSGMGNAAHPVKERGNDLYETPDVAVTALLNVENLPEVIWEPACGPGLIVRMLRATGRQVYATALVDYNSPDQDCAGWDFMMETQLPLGVQAIVTNPPFK